jgi:hypothetical protein
MGQAVGQDSLEVLGGIPGQGITHLNRRGQPGGPALEQVVEVFPGMLMPGAEQGDPVPLVMTDQAGGKDAFTRTVRVPFLQVGQDLHGGVVVVDQLSLSRLVDQGLIGRG